MLPKKKLKLQKIIDALDKYKFSIDTIYINGDGFIEILKLYPLCFISVDKKYNIEFSETMTNIKYLAPLGELTKTDKQIICKYQEQNVCCYTKNKLFSSSLKYEIRNKPIMKKDLKKSTIDILNEEIEEFISPGDAKSMKPVRISNGKIIFDEYKEDLFNEDIQHLSPSDTHYPTTMKCVDSGYKIVCMFSLPDFYKKLKTQGCGFIREESQNVINHNDVSRRDDVRQINQMLDKIKSLFVVGTSNLLKEEKKVVTEIHRAEELLNKTHKQDVINKIKSLIEDLNEEKYKITKKIDDRIKVYKIYTSVILEEIN